MKLVALPLSLALLFAPGALAQSRTFAVDPEASKVAFTLGGNTHRVEGTFHVQDGTIRFDPASGAISGSVVVQAGSGNSGNKSRDRKMHTDILDVAHFADVTFEPRSYQGTFAASGDSAIQVTGIFTLHGTPHDLTVPMQMHAEGTTLAAKGQFRVPYVQWGLKDPSFFVLRVAKEVEVELTLQGTVTPAN
jgi:polyisoprenoid-binding protein YceI